MEDVRRSLQVRPGVIFDMDRQNDNRH